MNHLALLDAAHRGEVDFDTALEAAEQYREMMADVEREDEVIERAVSRDTRQHSSLAMSSESS